MIPVPIPIHGGGGLSSETGIAFWIVLNFLIIVSMLARFYFIRNHKNFYAQSAFKNFFCDIKSDYDIKYNEDNIWINPGTIGLTVINGIAIIVSLTLIVSNWIK